MNLKTLGLFKHTHTHKAKNHQGQVWKFILPFSSRNNWIFFLCLHTLGFSIHLHWHYVWHRGTPAVPPNLLSTHTQRFRPPKTEEKNNSSMGKGRYCSMCVSVWRLCAGLWYVCVCVSISFFRNIMSLDRAASGTLEWEVHTPSVAVGSM